MTYPMDRLLEYLRSIDEVALLDLLGLTTEDILDRFKDIVYNKRHILEKEVELLPNEDDSDGEEYED